MTAPVIVGAGLAGLIAAHAWPQLSVFESSSAPSPGHRALLRFRNDSVAKLTGIEFRQVTVRKAVFHEGRFCEPTIALANRYSKKVLGRILPDRSIWNLSPAPRYVAPDDFYEQLVEAVGARISWSSRYRFDARDRGPVISTAPLPVTCEALGVSAGPGSGLNFLRSPITVHRAKVPRCDVFQTVYYPGDETTLYRASITGDTLIAEFAGDPQEGWLDDMILPAFGIEDALLENFETGHKQQYGKIAPVPDDKRKALLFRLTHEHQVFSLGRFATWRNILLDDVVEDIAVVKRLIRSSGYDLRKGMS